MNSLPQWGRGRKRGKFSFNHRKHAPDRGPVLFPGEMNGDAWLPVAGAHPQVIGSDGTDLRDQQVRTHLVAQPFDRKDRIDRVAPGHEVFRLKFFPGARGEAHAKVRQPVVPGPGHAHLLGAVLGGKLGDGVKISGCKLGAEEFPWCRESLPFSDAALDPDLIDALLLPVGKQD